jgi:hypothetical protein
MRVALLTHMRNGLRTTHLSRMFEYVAHRCRNQTITPPGTSGFAEPKRIRKSLASRWGTRIGFLCSW